MDLIFEKITDQDLPQFKSDMQTAFQLGAEEGGYPTDDIILPEEDIDRSLKAKGSAAYKVVLNGEIVGGAIVVTDKEKSRGHLDFLYVKSGIQSKGIGKFIWYSLEKLYTDTRIWETCTPYFEKRNIHFYVNVCHFKIVEFINKFHIDPDNPEDEMFIFRKTIK